MKRLCIIIMLMASCWELLTAQVFRVGDLYTAPDGSKGIVYYVLPDGTGAWAVALNDASSNCAWGNLVDVPELANQNPANQQMLLYDTSGYANTQILRNFQNNNTYAAGVVNFNHGWCLPSPGQLRMLHARMPLIAGAVIAAGGSYMANDWYWTSAEQNSAMAWQVDFGHYAYHGRFHAADKSSHCHVRAVCRITYDPTYVWSTGDTGPSITVSPEQTTAYTVTVTTPIGCSDSAAQTITVLHYDTTHLYETVCDSYVWSGDSLVQSGTYSHTLTSTTGCDSVVTLHLTVHHSTSQTLPISIVENDLPYSFLDTIFQEAGTYVLTLENEAGCDSTLTVVLNVFENVINEVDSLLCEGELPIVWNGVEFTEAGSQPAVLTAASGADSVVLMTVSLIPTTYGAFDTAVVENALPIHYHNLLCDTAGTYTDTLVNAAGCDSILTLNLTVWPNVTSVAYDTVCESALPFTWNDSVFTTAGTKMTTILAHTGADSTVTMMLTVNPTTYGTFDTAVVENALPFQLHHLTCDSAGVYTDTLVNAAGCDSILTLNLTVYPNVTSEIDTAVCEGDFPITWNDSLFTLPCTMMTTILAHTGADSTIIMTMSLIPTTYGMATLAVVENMLPYTYNDSTYAGAGTYVQNLTNVFGCDSILTVVIEVYENVSSLADSTVCESELPILWNGVEFTQAGTQSSVLAASTGADSAVVMTLTVIPTTYGTFDTAIVENALPLQFHNLVCNAAGVYTDTLVNAAGCDSVLTLNLTVWPNVTSTLDSTVCEGELPITWNDSVFTTAGTKTTTILAHTGADSTITMTLAVIPTTYGTLDTAAVQNALPVHINDSVYSLGGTYTQFLSNSADCDSILTVNLTVWPNVTSEIDSTVCEDDFPFTWNDSVFAEAGTKTTTILAHTGADSTITMTVTMAMTTYGTLDTAIVENALPFHIHNLICDSAGVYADTIANAAGCDSILSVLVTVYENVTGEDDSTLCADALPLTWNGVTFTQAGTQTATLLAHTGADSVVTMTLHVNPLSYTTIDTAIIQNNLPFHYVNGLIDTTFGAGTTMISTSQFVFPNVNGCDSVVTLNLMVYQNVANTVDTSVCAADMPYTWHGHNFTAAGSFPMTLLTSHGADSVVTYTLSVDNLSVSIGSVTHVTCFGASTGAATANVTGGQGPFTYQWTNSSNTTVATTTALSNRPAGTYTFTVTDHLGCTATATTTLNTLNGALTPGTIAASQEVCDGEVVAPFTGSAASGGDNGHYQWQISTNGTDWTNAPGTSNTQGYTYPNTASSAFTLRRAWVSQSCGTVNSNEVTVSVWPNSSDTIVASVCQGETYSQYNFDVTAEQTEEAGEYSFEQHHATGHCDSAVVLLLTVYPVEEELVEAEICEGEGYNSDGFNVSPQETIGEDEIELTQYLQSVHGCDSVVTLHLTVIDTALRIEMLTDDFCENNEAALTVVTGMSDYVWSTGETATTIAVTSPGLYSVTATQGGCSATAQIRVEGCHLELVLPNAITPSSGDGLNDCFFIPEGYTANISLFKVYIYNRWGELVFYSTDKNFRWYGEYRDQTQYQAVYSYVIEYTDLAGRPTRLSGSVTVL